MNTFNWVCTISVIVAAIGAINWLLTVMKNNLVEKIFGVDTKATKAVYVLVGLCGIVALGCKVLWLTGRSGF